MKRRNSMKKIISIFLIAVLVFTMFGGVPKKEVKAASEIQGVTLSLSSKTSNTAYKFSTLPSEYMGIRYCYEAYVDGSMTPVTDIFSLTATEIYGWNGSMKTSYVIPKGTIFYEYDTTNSVKVENGKQLRLAEEFKIVKETDGWKQVSAETQSVTLSLYSRKTNNQFTYSSLLNFYRGTRYCFDAYKDGQLTTDVCNFYNDKEYAEGWGGPTTSYFIPAGTIFYEYDSSTGSKVEDGKQLKLTEDFKIVQENGVWKQVSTIQGVTFSLHSPNSGGMFNYSTMPTEYIGKRFCYYGYADGASTAVKDVGKLQSNGYLETWMQGGQKTSYFIPAGTIFYETSDANPTTPIEGGKQFKLNEDFRIEHVDGAWKQVFPPSVSLKLENVTTSQWELTHSDLAADYIGTSSKPVKYRYDAYVDGGSISEQGWMNFLGDKIELYNTAFPGTPVTSYFIPKGTVLYEYDYANQKDVENGKQLKLAEDFYVVKIGEQWIQKTNNRSVKLDFVSVDSENRWTLSFNNLEMCHEGEFTFKGQVDGVSQQITIDFPSTTSTEEGNLAHAYIESTGFDGGMPTSSLLIPAGTVLTNNSEVICTVTDSLYVNLINGVWGKEQLPSVKLDLKEVADNNGNGDVWYFTYEGVPSEYIGSTSTYYEVSAYINGSSELGKIYIGMLNGDVYAYTNMMSPQNCDSYRITEKAIAYEIDKSSWKVLPDGKKFEFTDGLTIEKCNNGWMNPNWPVSGGENDVRPYSLDNGVYKFTANAALEVVKQPTAVKDVLQIGSEATVPGDYSVVQYDNQTKFMYTVALYKYADANLDGADTLDLKDLVAAKKAEKENNAVTNYARWYASDVTGNQTVDAEDLSKIRKFLVGAEEKNDYVVSNKAITLLGKNEMPILGFSGPSYKAGLLNGIDYNTMTDEVYQLVQESGIKAISYTPYQDFSEQAARDKVIQNLKLADKYNLGMYVHDSTFSEREKQGKTVEELQEGMSRQIGLYSAYKSFLGLHIVDEPHTATYKPDSMAADALDRDLDHYDNVIGMVKEYTNLRGYVNIDYLTGFDTFIDTMLDRGVDMISYDYYPISASKEGDTWKKNINYEKFYTSLNILRKKMQDKENPFWVTAQVGNSNTTEEVIPNECLQTPEELQWEINAGLAFGAKGIQYYSVIQGFAYSGLNQITGVGSVQGNRQGLISIDGTKNTRYYDAVKRVNLYITEIDQVLMNASNQGMISNDTNVTDYISLNDYTDSVLRSVDGEKYLIGCFDYRGKKAYLVVNTDITNTATSHSYTLNLADNAAYTLYQQNNNVSTNCCAKSTGKTVDKKVTINNLAAGQSALIVLD